MDVKIDYFDVHIQRYLNVMDVKIDYFDVYIQRYLNVMDVKIDYFFYLFVISYILTSNQRSSIMFFFFQKVTQFLYTFKFKRTSNANKKSSKVLNFVKNKPKVIFTNVLNFKSLKKNVIWFPSTKSQNFLISLSNVVKPPV